MKKERSVIIVAGEENFTRGVSASGVLEVGEPWKLAPTS